MMVCTLMNTRAVCVWLALARLCLLGGAFFVFVEVGGGIQLAASSCVPSPCDERIMLVPYISRRAALGVESMVHSWQRSRNL